MPHRQRFFWRVMGLERRLSGPMLPTGGASLPQRKKATTAPDEEHEGKRESRRTRPERKAASAKRGKPAEADAPVKKQEDALPEVEELKISHLAAQSLFGAGALVPQVSDLEGGSKAEKLASLEAWLGECKRCGLHANRTNIVFGEHNAEARIVFVGEGPGADEDRTGRPFVGRAGKLLDQMIEAMGLKREDVYICNVVKCRPPGNRTPTADEGAVCGPVMFRQLEIIEPELIIAMGGPAVHTLLESKDGITKLRSRLFRYGRSLLLPTFHPAYLLRNPPAKKPAWQDLLIACRLLGLKPKTRKKE